MGRVENDEVKGGGGGAPVGCQKGRGVVNGRSFRPLKGRTRLMRAIHPASRGVAAHTAGLFRSVRGAKGGFPPWGLPKLRIFTFPPVGGVGAPQAREFSLSPPVGAPQAREFPPVGGSPS